MKKGKSTGFSFADLSLNDYESVFVIDAIDDSYVEYSAGDADSQLVVHGYGDNFFLDVAGNLRSQVWEEDKGYFVRTFNKTTIMESLRSMKDRYPMMITFINQVNPLSYAAHTRKVRMDEVGTFDFNGNHYWWMACPTDMEC